MKKISLIVCLLILHTVLFSQRLRISVIGSSTASGYGLFYQNGTNQDLYTAGNDSNSYPYYSWPNQYKRYLQQYGVLDSLYNFSIWAEDVYQAYPTGASIPSWAINGPAPDINNNVTKALSVNPDIVIVNFPSNNYDNAKYTIARIMAAFRFIYNSIISNGHTRCYICTTEPRPGFGETIELNKMKPLKDSIIKEFPNNYINFWDGVVASNGWDVLPQYKNSQMPDQGANGGPGYDGVHYNAQGHTIFFDSVVAENVVFILTSSLPVKFLNPFSAIKTTNGIEFSWTTAMEQNNKTFIIEAYDSLYSSWQEITEVNSYWSNGTSSQAHTYIYNWTPLMQQQAGMEVFVILLILGMNKINKIKRYIFCILSLSIFFISCQKTSSELTNNLNYHNFRLKQIDFDGKINYSNIIRI